MKQTRASIFSRQSTGDRVFEIVNTGLLFLVLLVILYPLWFVVIASVSDPAKVVAGDVLLWPAGVSFEAYRMVFRDSMIMTGYRNTLYYTILGTAINLVMTVLAAYPLSRKDWVGRGFFMAVVMFTMFFSGGTIPTYLLMNDLGLINTTWAIVLPGAVSVYNTIIMRTFFVNSIPPELQEAAYVDGANIWQRIWHVDLPGIIPTAIILLILNTASVLNVGYEKVYLLQNSLNMSASDVISTYVYRVGLVDMNYSFSTAVNLFQSVISLLLMAIVNSIARKASDYSLW